MMISSCLPADDHYLPRFSHNFQRNIDWHWQSCLEVINSLFSSERKINTLNNQVFFHFLLFWILLFFGFFRKKEFDYSTRFNYKCTLQASYLLFCTLNPHCKYQTTCMYESALGPTNKNWHYNTKTK